MFISMLLGSLKMKLSAKWKVNLGMSAICQLLNIEKMLEGNKTNKMSSFNI